MRKKIILAILLCSPFLFSCSPKIYYNPNYSESEQKYQRKRDSLKCKIYSRNAVQVPNINQYNSFNPSTKDGRFRFSDNYGNSYTGTYHETEYISKKDRMRKQTDQLMQQSEIFEAQSLRRSAYRMCMEDKGWIRIEKK
jgi:hypothetical protein